MKSFSNCARNADQQTEPAGVKQAAGGLLPGGEQRRRERVFRCRRVWVKEVMLKT